MNVNNPDQLYECAERGRYFEVQSLLSNGVDPNAENHFSKKPLMVAAQGPHKEVAELLINSGANIHESDSDECTVLHHASSKGWVEIVRILVNKGIELNAANVEGETPLILAAQKSHRDVVQLLVQSGADMHYRDEEGWTVLHHAAYRGSVDIVQCLLNEGVDLNVKDSIGQSPLMLAAQNSHKEFITQLIKSGADVEGRDADGCTVLHHAVSGGSPEMVKFLVSKKVPLDSKNSEGETPLHYAVQENESEIADCLLKAGADCNLKDNKGESPFSYLVRKKTHINTMKVCIEKGAYVTDTDYYKLQKDDNLRVILQDVKLCTLALLNKFNNKDLPFVYKALESAPVLPPITQMAIGDTSQAALEVEQAVTQEIETKGFCDLTKIVPAVLSILCVKAVIERLPRPPNQGTASTSRSSLKRPRSSKRDNLYKRLCIKKWTEMIKMR